MTLCSAECQMPHIEALPAKSAISIHDEQIQNDEHTSQDTLIKGKHTEDELVESSLLSRPATLASNAAAMTNAPTAPTKLEPPKGFTLSGSTGSRRMESKMDGGLVYASDPLSTDCFDWVTSFSCAQGHMYALDSAM